MKSALHVHFQSELVCIALSSHLSSNTFISAQVGQNQDAFPESKASAQLVMQADQPESGPEAC